MRRWRLAFHHGLPALDGVPCPLDQDFSQQVEADAEDGLRFALVGLDDDRPMPCPPFPNRMGKAEGDGQHSDELGDPFRIGDVGVLEVEPARLAGREQCFDVLAPAIIGHGDLGIGVGRHDQ